MKAPCQALVVRYAPSSRLGEALNIGVILVSAELGFAGARFVSSTGRVTAAFKNTDPVVLRRVSGAFDEACDAAMAQLPGLFPLDDVRQFAATVVQPDDAPIQVSQVISGLTEDPDRTLAELFRQYITDGAAGKRRSRDDATVWRGFVKLVPEDVRVRLRPTVLRTPNYKLQLDHTWRNGVLKAAVPLSLDLVEPDSIRDKATAWSGKLHTVRPWDRGARIYLLYGHPSRESSKPVREAARDAVAILTENLRDYADGVRAIDEGSAAALAEEIVADVRSHD